MTRYPRRKEKNNNKQTNERQTPQKRQIQQKIETTKDRKKTQKDPFLRPVINPNNGFLQTAPHPILYSPIPALILSSILQPPPPPSLPLPPQSSSLSPSLFAVRNLLYFLLSLVLLCVAVRQARLCKILRFRLTLISLCVSLCFFSAIRREGGSVL